MIPVRNYFIVLALGLDELEVEEYLCPVYRPTIITNQLPQCLSSSVVI